MGRRVLVCGGRKYDDWIALDEILNKLIHDEDFMIEGGANGADALARLWAYENGIPCASVRAAWDAYGKAAGAIRNGWMLRLQPDLVIAFPGGKGTANMIKLAKEAGVEVIEVGEQDK